MNYQLQAIVNGKVQLFPVAELGMHVPVQPDAKYTLLDENGTAVVDGLVLQKKGHNLYIQVDGDSVAVIDDFSLPVNGAGLCRNQPHQALEQRGFADAVAP